MSAPERDGAGVGFRLLVDQREDALRRGDPALDHGIHVGQRLQLIEQMQQCGHVGDEVARAILPAGALADRDPQDHADRDRDDDLVDRRSQRGGGGLLRHRQTQPIRRVAQPPALVLLAAEHLDDAVRADRLFQRVRERAGAFLDEHAHPLQAPADLLQRVADQRKRGERDQRELPVDVEQVRQHERDRQRVADAHRDGVGRRRRDLLRVERDLGEQEAGRGRVVVGRRQAQQVVGGLAAQVEHHARTDPREPVVARVGADAAQQEHADERERQPPGRFGADRADVVEQRLDDAQHHHVGRRDDQHADDREREHPPVGADVTEDPAKVIQGSARPCRPREGTGRLYRSSGGTPRTRTRRPL